MLRDAIAEPAVAVPVALGTFVCVYGIGLAFLGVEEEDRKLAIKAVRWVGKATGAWQRLRPLSIQDNYH